jgi:linoleoyl-CoA desaturase
MHEGAHNSYSNKSWLNKISAYMLNILGGNAQFWRIKHNINHHTYTNIEGLDGDIDIKPLMRLSEGQPRRSFHKFQHIYGFGLYGISYFIWIFIQDFQKYFSGKIAAGNHPKMTLKDHFIFWISKLWYVTIYLAVPILSLGLGTALLGYLVMGVCCGLFLSVVFQLAHTVEGLEFPTPNPETQKIEQEWAIHQVTTTSNFATKNKVICWLLGGLNFQVEHHLFPRISHIHYPRINAIVKETCAEFNVPYQEHPTMFKAIRSHLTYIKHLGRA